MRAVHGALRARRGGDVPIQAAHYDADEATFRADLAKKSWVIQIFDEARNLRGFATVVLWGHHFGGRDIKIVFAGDTVVDRRYWGHRALPVKWLEVTGALRARNPDKPLYWLLTSMHPRTYRFMPLYYRRKLSGRAISASSLGSSRHMASPARGPAPAIRST